jgi:hypothetical protein
MTISPSPIRSVFLRNRFNCCSVFRPNGFVTYRLKMNIIIQTNKPNEITIIAQNSGDTTKQRLVNEL